MIIIGVYLVQPFLTAALDLPARICVVAGFWHISWIAGVGMLANGLVAVAVHAVGYLSLTRDQTATAQEVRAPGDIDS